MIVGLDISTKRIGLCAIGKNGIAVRTQTFFDKQSHTERRHIILSMLRDMKIKRVFVEEVRLFSFSPPKGKFKGRNFINTKTIFRLLSILITLIDNEIEVYTINARSWKSRILKKQGFDKSKDGSVKYVKYKYNIDVNHDTADAICIAEYAKKFKEMTRRFE